MFVFVVFCQRVIIGVERNENESVDLMLLLCVKRVKTCLSSRPRQRATR